MKQILPILTLTTLAAAASAQSAPAADGLDYNRASFSRNSQDNTLAVQALLGGSNILAGVQTSNAESGNVGTQLTLGYVFKNVLASADITVSASQGAWQTRTVYGIAVRRQLNEVIKGLEFTVGFSSTMKAGVNSTFGLGGANNTSDVAWNTELAYNINKNYQLAVGLVDFHNQSNQIVTTLRYNF
jgi:hypothetical protein